jgi:putative hydrolase of HD superfamily
MNTFINNLENSLPIQNIFQLWKEYEDSNTPEAKLVKDLDKFEMLVQAFEYEKGN